MTIRETTKRLELKHFVRFRGDSWIVSCSSATLPVCLILKSFALQSPLDRGTEVLRLLHRFSVLGFSEE